MGWGLYNYFMSLVLYIKSAGRDDKSFFIEKNGKKEEVKVKGDLLQELKEYLRKRGLNLSDFTDFVAVPTESFTGYREAIVITNTLKHYVLGVPIEKLPMPKYSKEPNINLKKF